MHLIVYLVLKECQPTIGWNTYQAAQLAKVVSAYCSSLVHSVKLSILKLDNLERTLVISMLIIIVLVPVDHEELFAHGVLKDVVLAQPPAPAPVEGGWLINTDGGRVNNTRLGLNIASLQALEDSLTVDALRPLDAQVQDLVPIPAAAVIDAVVRVPAIRVDYASTVEESLLAIHGLFDQIRGLLTQMLTHGSHAVVPTPAPIPAAAEGVVTDLVVRVPFSEEVRIHTDGLRLNALEAIARVPAVEFDQLRLMDRRVPAVDLDQLRMMDRRLFDLRALESRGLQSVADMRLMSLDLMRLESLAGTRRLHDLADIEDRLLQMVLDRIHGAR